MSIEARRLLVPIIIFSNFFTVSEKKEENNKKVVSQFAFVVFANIASDTREVTMLLICRNRPEIF